HATTFFYSIDNHGRPSKVRASLPRRQRHSGKSLEFHLLLVERIAGQAHEETLPPSCLSLVSS
ncbi:uncharacterized, partial [Tachysurus ichikawai]